MNRIRVAAAVLLLAAVQVPLLAQNQPEFPVLPERTPQLVILSAVPQPGNVTLHVTGRNFCEMPAVSVGGTPLAVANVTETSFDVLLPIAIQPGTYLLEVSCGKGRIFNDTFLVVIQ
jgi:hypothetical protein